MSDEIDTTEVDTEAKAEETTTETDVDAGSENSGEQSADTEAKAEETVSADAGEAAAADEGADATPKVGDPCVCPDGVRKGTLQAGAEEGTLVCLPFSDQDGE